MITNFESLTEKLTPEELRLVDVLVGGFVRRTAKNPIKEPEIIKAINANQAKYGLKKKFTGVRLRKLCNYIRSNGIIPLIGTSEGYYCDYNKPAIEKQIKSLTERADRIMSAANGLKKFLQ